MCFVLSAMVSVRSSTHTGGCEMPSSFILVFNRLQQRLLVNHEDTSA
jgi:hypothetical protein